MSFTEEERLQYEDSISSYKFGDQFRGDVGGIQQHAASRERHTLAQRETRAVRILRIIMLSLLLLTGIAVCLLVFLHTRNEEYKDFHEAFEAYAFRVIDSFQESLEAQLGALDAFSVTITSYAISSNSTFPFVTVPHWELRGANARIGAKAFLIHHAPVVTAEELPAWAEYTNQTVHEFHRALESETELRNKQDAEYGLDPVIENSYVDDKGDPYTFNPNIWGPSKPPYPEIYLPIWQFSPLVPLILRSLNFDTTRFDIARTENINQVLTTKRASLSRLFEVPNDPRESSEITTNDVADIIVKNSQFRHNVGKYTGDAISVMNYPVFSNFDYNNRKLVGVLSSNLYWRSFFTDVLPPNANGIICVLKNTADQTFTYRIDGRDAYVLGGGDLHDIKYDEFVATEELTSYVEEKARPETRGYTEAHLNPDNIKHHIYVYPSQDTANLFLTNKPYIYTAVVALIFVFASLVFLLYDYLVERRQGIVMNRAVTSTAVVSSLFPEQVREKILEGAAEKDAMEKGNDSGLSRGKTNYLDKYVLNREPKYNDDTDSKPIADKFQNATVLFADMAGFTQWSSQREPEDVFKLLETLFGALDAIALRRKVFKVETIGDCYMAVTGVPKSQPDHAVIMARFSRDCLIRAKDVFTSLADTLGVDTLDLAMRIGLHSGEVTAGVLRGDKLRFQLFGDTVNTAARMESLGLRGRIHCSQSTADELILSGNEKWLVSRDGPVQAKGKGKMQTYFLDGLMTGTLFAVVNSTSDRNNKEFERKENKLLSDDDDDDDDDDLISDDVIPSALYDAAARLSSTDMLPDTDGVRHRISFVRH